MKRMVGFLVALSILGSMLLTGCGKNSTTTKELSKYQEDFSEELSKYQENFSENEVDENDFKNESEDCSEILYVLQEFKNGVASILLDSGDVCVINKNGEPLCVISGTGEMQKYSDHIEKIDYTMYESPYVFPDGYFYFEVETTNVDKKKAYLFSPEGDLCCSFLLGTSKKCDYISIHYKVSGGGYLVAEKAASGFDESTNRFYLVDYLGNETNEVLEGTSYTGYDDVYELYGDAELYALDIKEPYYIHAKNEDWSTVTCSLPAPPKIIENKYGVKVDFSDINSDIDFYTDVDSWKYYYNYDMFLLNENDFLCVSDFWWDEAFIYHIDSNSTDVVDLPKGEEMVIECLDENHFLVKAKGADENDYYAVYDRGGNTIIDLTQIEQGIYCGMIGGKIIAEDLIGAEENLDVSTVGEGTCYGSRGIYAIDPFSGEAELIDVNGAIKNGYIGDFYASANLMCYNSYYHSGGGGIRWRYDDTWLAYYYYSENASTTERKNFISVSGERMFEENEMGNPIIKIDDNVPRY